MPQVYEITPNVWKSQELYPEFKTHATLREAFSEVRLVTKQNKKKRVI